MELFQNLIFGFGVALTWQNLLYCMIGVSVGTLIGVLPGIGPLATIAMLLPLTFNVAPVGALIMLAGIYYGAQYGGSTTAILVNLPGESSSVVTCLDGYQMARKGRAGPALAAVREYVTKLSQSRDRLYEVGIKRVAADFQPLEQLLERTKDDFRSIEPGLRYFRQPEERTDMIVRLEKDRRLYRLAEREFAFGSGLLDMLTKLLTPGTEAELMQSLDTNANGQIELAELPEAWKDLPRSGDRDAALIYTVPELLTEVASGARDLRDKYLLRMAQSLEIGRAHV